MMAIVMQNTAVCRVAEASLRTVRALRRPQRALQRPLRHAQSLPCLPHRAEGSVCNEFPSLQSAALVGFTRSAGRNDGWLGHSCGFRARAPLSMADNGCLLATFAFAQFLGCFIQSVNPALHKLCSRMFMTRAAGGLVLAAPFSNRVFQEFLLLLHEAWATVFALSRVLWGSEQLFLRCKRTSIAHDVKIT